jgi:RNA polymerase sigma factor (sigma-70 family)
MDDPTLTFDSHRRRLQGIAYRMLGSVAEAEEVVQDAWLRWYDADKNSFDSAEAWLVTVVTRLSIDRLRAAKVQREHYIGPWMPEPTLTDGPDTPEQLLERADNISVAFLAVLERLAPESRAAFLLREVFDADYDEVARTLGKSEAACRQLVHRARLQVQEHGAGRHQRRARHAALSRRRARIGADLRDRERPHRAHPRAAQSRQAGAHRATFSEIDRRGCHRANTSPVFSG